VCTCFLGLIQRNASVDKSNVHSFANFDGISFILTDDSTVQPDLYHLHFIIDMDVVFEKSAQTRYFSYRTFASGYIAI
jgi:hypothetical protein